MTCPVCGSTEDDCLCIEMAEELQADFPHSDLMDGDEARDGGEV